MDTVEKQRGEARNEETENSREKTRKWTEELDVLMSEWNIKYGPCLSKNRLDDS